MATQTTVRNASLLDGADDGYLHHLLLSPLEWPAIALGRTIESFSPLLLCALVLLTLGLAGLLRVLWPLAKAYLQIHRFFTGSGGELPYLTRRIHVRLPSNVYTEVPNHNIFLQNAILVFVGEHCWRRHPLPSHLRHGRQLQVDLMDPYRSWRSSRADNTPFEAGEVLRQTTRTPVETSLEVVNRLQVVRVPVNAWLPIFVDDIEVSLEEQEYKLAHFIAPWTRRTVSLRCRAKRGAAKRLDAFVQRALEAFAASAPEKDASETRWFFTYGGTADDHILFQRYVLRSHKGFDTLFFPRRDATLALVDQFTQRRGRFAVEGFPQRLGFLLYGPAGTGRHAFVKALAAYTGRHVVSVPLSKLRTNQQLYDIFFVREFQASRDGSKQKLRMEDAIFLFDDVDAADAVVCARAERRVVQRRGGARLSAGGGGDGSGSNGGRGGGALASCVVETSRASAHVAAVSDAALPMSALMGLMLGGAATSGGSGAAGERSKRRGRGGGDGGGAVPAVRPALGLGDVFGGGGGGDRLDLAGLLNVLDGVVDAPGRVVVMITEHPEWLDPALVRPGRFSVRLRMDYVEMPALLGMLGLYYGDIAHAAVAGGDAAAAARAVHRELSEAQAAAVRCAVAALETEAEARGEECGYRFQLTPCEVEMLCMAQDTLDDFLAQLAALVRGTLQL